MNTDCLIITTAPKGPKPELYRSYIDGCVGAASSIGEELKQFITAVNLFHPALKYSWEISDSSLAFLDIKVSMKGNGLCISVQFKITDSHSLIEIIFTSTACQEYNSLSSVLRLRRVCSEDSDFP